MENVDNAENSNVIVSNLKDGLFTVQTKFSMSVGAGIAKVKSDAYLTIKEGLDHQGINLSVPTSIQIENASN